MAEFNNSELQFVLLVKLTHSYLKKYDLKWPLYPKIFIISKMYHFTIITYSLLVT